MATLHSDLLKMLRCPACVSSAGKIPGRDGVLVPDGADGLVCRSCGARYPIVAGIPDIRLETGWEQTEEQKVDTGRRSG